MKQTALLAIVAILSTAPLLAQTAEQRAEATATSDVAELRSASRLPEAVKEARAAGTEEEEIANVVKDIQEKRLSSGEGVNTIRIMEENTTDGVSNKGISDFVAEQKAKGVQGEELGKAVKAELQARHRVRVEEGRGATERKEERTGTEEETLESQPTGRGGQGQGQKEKGQTGTQTPESRTEEETAEKPTEKTTK
ncbi:hypothetical protein IBX73_07790 [candidate division WOR-3 bacterium]|nr:hypothetical protein [candidate division WOR-3 bacterium]